jgi:exopolysaccharide biosynthesis glucuronosyltransferase PssE
MIFASVGSMLPFDRFVKAVDEWAASNPSEEVFVQIGRGEYEPRHAPFARMMPHTEYRQRLEDCDLFVAHVGMGSILQSLETRKQLLMLPRLVSLREHTTDHQLHTAARIRGLQGLLIVDDAEALKAAMTRLLREPLAPSAGIPRYAPQPMIDKVAEYLTAGSARQ